MERSLAFTALLEIPAFGKLTQDEAADCIADFIEHWHAAGKPGTLYSYAPIYWAGMNGAYWTLVPSANGR